MAEIVALLQHKILLRRQQGVTALEQLSVPEAAALLAPLLKAASYPRTTLPISESGAAWEPTHGALLGGAAALRRAPADAALMRLLLGAAARCVTAHGEARVRGAAAEALAACAAAAVGDGAGAGGGAGGGGGGGGGAAVYRAVAPALLSSIRSCIAAPAERSSAAGGVFAPAAPLCAAAGAPRGGGGAGGAGAGGAAEGAVAQAQRLRHESEGWRSLETSMGCLRCDRCCCCSCCSCCWCCCFSCCLLRLPPPPAPPAPPAPPTPPAAAPRADTGLTRGLLEAVGAPLAEELCADYFAEILQVIFLPLFCCAYAPTPVPHERTYARPHIYMRRQQRSSALNTSLGSCRGRAPAAAPPRRHR